MEEVRGIKLKNFLESFNRAESHSCTFRITREINGCVYCVDFSSSGIPALYDCLYDDIEFFDWRVDENADGFVIEIIIEE